MGGITMLTYYLSRFYINITNFINVIRSMLEALPWYVSGLIYLSFLAIVIKLVLRILRGY